MSDKKWIQAAVNRMKQKGTVGTFTHSAQAHHMSPMAYANKIASDPNATTLEKRRANFVRNVSG